ncbi:uncharacterized protein LOC134527389 [Bacillus rossius redtenbacheri]|uniref:uncharacterized protein LOC134527389 n=1 Tax=Bacillus rossius redtenbacheri TaxID=93214 RepID=UPI002FDCF4A0
MLLMFFLQQEAPAIHIQRHKLQGLLIDLLVRFVKPSALLLGSTSITDVNFKKRKFQKDDTDLVIGAKCRAELKASTSQSDSQTFYSSVRAFYVSSSSYILDFLQHVEVFDISLRTTASYSSVLYFVERFPRLINVSELDILEQEFVEYQCDSFSSDTLKEKRMDVVWYKISNIKNESGQPKYKTLPKIMLVLLTVTHSNASTKRIFSNARRNQTEYRASLSTSTLGALMVEKVKSKSYSEVCYKKNSPTRNSKKLNMLLGTSLPVAVICRKNWRMKWKRSRSKKVKESKDTTTVKFKYKIKKNLHAEKKLNS